MSRATDAPQRRAEILKLARLLERDPEELAYLEPIGLEDLRALREQTIEVLWSADSASLGRLAAASRLLPASLVATIAERAFGPLLTARMAGQLDPTRAVDVAARLPTEFLADVAIELDPRRASAMLALLVPAQVAAITALLVTRGEHVTMGQFVGHLGDESIRAALSVMDDATLLRVGFVLEDRDRLARVVALMPDERLAGLVATAAKEDLWTELLALVEDGATLQAELADRLPSLPAAQRRALARRAAHNGTIERLGPLGRALTGA